MVYVIHNCQCGLCPGSSSPPKREDGQRVFGGSICHCKCHVLTGKKRKDFILMQNKFNPLPPQEGKERYESNS